MWSSTRGGALINREEFTPYGETSFGSFARKRYRFTGKERDEESGLSYHGARYYSPWVGRWLSPDPAGTVDGLCLYAYVLANPINAVDRDGFGFWSVVVDTITDVVFPLKPAIKAAVKGDYEDAVVLGTTPGVSLPDVKLGIWDAEKDFAKGVAWSAMKSSLGPLSEIITRGSALLQGDFAAAFPKRRH